MIMDHDHIRKDERDDRSSSSSTGRVNNNNNDEDEDDNNMMMVGSCCPFSIEIEVLDRMLNFEIVDHPVFRGLEMQGFDDPQHGKGMLVFLSRIENEENEENDKSISTSSTTSGTTTTTTTKTDVYYQKGLRPNRELYGMGGGLGLWQEAWAFSKFRLEITDEKGVEAELDFLDVQGRRIQVEIYDPSATSSTPQPKISTGFLAPMGAAITHPKSLPLVYMTQFDLLHHHHHHHDHPDHRHHHHPLGERPSSNMMIAIDGRSVSTGHLLFERFLNRRLIKVAKDVCIVSVNPTTTTTGKGREGGGGGGKVEYGPLPQHPVESVQLDRHGNIGSIKASSLDNKHTACLRFEPSFPCMMILDDNRHALVPSGGGGGGSREGTWSVDIDDCSSIVGGSWNIQPIRVVEPQNQEPESHEDDDHDPRCHADDDDDDADNDHEDVPPDHVLRYYNMVLNVTQGWRPKGLPALMKLVTTMVSTFRTWPTTYRWTASVKKVVVVARRPKQQQQQQQEKLMIPLHQEGTSTGTIRSSKNSRAAASSSSSAHADCCSSCYSMVAQWERTGQDRGESYQRAFG